VRFPRLERPAAQGPTERVERVVPSPRRERPAAQGPTERVERVVPLEHGS
jgi:hypothetical protein